jgi:hypothetical protein
MRSLVLGYTHMAQGSGIYFIARNDLSTWKQRPLENKSNPASADRQREDRSRSIQSSSSSSSKVVAALDFFHYQHDNEGTMDH